MTSTLPNKIGLNLEHNEKFFNRFLWRYSYLLEAFEIEKLYLIDPYIMYETYMNSESKNYAAIQQSLGDEFMHAKKVLKSLEENIKWVKINV